MTYDPVKVADRPKVGMFSGLPSAAPGTVLVVDREGQQVTVLDGPGDRLTAGEARWGRIRTLYAVDITDHHLEFSDVLPCKDDVGGFRATVKLSCKVTDPAGVVHRGIHDVARVLVPQVTETLRRVCGEFAAEESDEAEKAGLARIRSLEAETGHDPAFRIGHIHLVLALDEAAATYIRERKETTRNLTRQQDAARLEKDKTGLEAELALTRDSLEAERGRMTAQLDQERLQMRRAREQLEAQLADQRQELELARSSARARSEQQASSELELERLHFETARQQRQAELDEQKLSLDIARARLEADYEKLQLTARLERDQLQVTQLTDLLSRGEFAALAMQLAQDPAAIGAVNAHLADQRDADINRQLHALKLLVENDGLEGYQITEQAKSVLLQLIGTWSARSKELPAVGAETPPELESVEVTVTSDSRDQPAADDEYPGDRPEAPDDPGGSSRASY